ncbi:MAG: glutamate racemase [Candidatus Levybacteria bacterium]|nr:glutamate racemase [Candidatus Levybacteria bacterium]
MKNQPIGILDSGIGGLTIWKEIVQELSYESTIYLADSKNCPYGNKTAGQIHELSRKMVQFLLKNNAKLIVIACNTITVSCLDKLRLEFPNVPIVGTVPVIKTAVSTTKNGRIGVLSTTQTANSKYQKDLIAKFAGDRTVINIGTDALVPLIEGGENSTSMIRIIKATVQPFKEAKIDVLALGCSHFPLIKDQIQQLLGSNVQILDSGAAIARQVRRVLGERNELAYAKEPRHQFFTSGSTNALLRALQSHLGYNAKDVYGLWQ